MKGSVIEYRGKRGVVFRIKYADAGGKQVMETVGAERNGITRVDAEQLLERRRVEVRDGLRKPEAKTFRQTAVEWHAAERTARAWKPNTATKYRQSAEHLAAHFRGPLEGLRSAERVDAYRDEALAAGLAPATVSRHLTVLNLILTWAVRKGLIESRPSIAYPKVRQKKGVVLSPEQVRALLRSFEDEQAKTAFLAFLLTGLRLSELQRLRWRDLSLTERRLRVEDSKTETGERSIAIPSALAAALEAQFQRTTFKGEDELVFCHPEIGSTYRSDRYKPALERAFVRAGLEWPEGFRSPRPARNRRDQLRHGRDAPRQAPRDPRALRPPRDAALRQPRRRRLCRRGPGARGASARASRRFSRNHRLSRESAGRSSSPRASSSWRRPSVDSAPGLDALFGPIPVASPA